MGKNSDQRKKRTVARTTNSAGMGSFQLDAETAKALKTQLSRFREEFGRHPEPDDPVFFNPYADTPEPVSPAQGDAIEHAIIEAMGKAGIDAALIYAYRKTGRIVTERNQHLLNDPERQEWDEALNEYGKLSKSQRA
jgi:hypothetical protein